MIGHYQTHEPLISYWTTLFVSHSMSDYDKFSYLSLKDIRCEYISSTETL